LALDTFLQVRFGLSIANAGTIALLVAGLLAILFFFGPNVNAVLVEKCAYQFSPWLVFIIYFWGVVENNWVPKNVKRNNIIAAIELLGSVVAAILALAFFTIRARGRKVDKLFENLYYLHMGSSWFNEIFSFRFFFQMGSIVLLF